VRRVNIHLDEEVDRELAAGAARRGMSKAALIREYVRRGIREATTTDPIDAIIGVGDGAPVDDIDEVLYGS
jgi:hypothetical protein